MSRALDQIEQLIPSLTGGEKARLLQIVANELGDSFPGVESTPGVCGGEVCIVRTRIPVWILVRALEMGTSEAELLRSYPTLRAPDLASAWAYARAHRDRIEADIRANEHDEGP